MPKISMEKKYRTRDGKPARVLCVDSGFKDHPVIAIISGNFIHSFTEDGFLHKDKCHYDIDLIEDTPYADFKIDEPVMVKDAINQTWLRGHFAGVNSNGSPTVWAGGGTSWTACFTQYWEECRRPTEQELKGIK